MTEGHPDKICDAISDSILDALLAKDPRSRVAVETMVTTGQVHVAGEVTTEAYADIPTIVREKILEIGYDSSAKGFDGHSCGVNVAIGAQSPDIAQGVDTAYEARHIPGDDDPLDKIGAGDQGMMFGFACTESEVYEKGSYMPAPIYFAHKILKVLSNKRRSGQIFDLQPDAKSQVTVKYVNGKPVGCTKVVVSTQHNAESRNRKKYTPGMVKDLIGDAVMSALAEIGELAVDGGHLRIFPEGDARGAS
mgnify:CR=1 FL=1